MENRPTVCLLGACEVTVEIMDIYSAEFLQASSASSAMIALNTDCTAAGLPPQIWISPEGDRLCTDKGIPYTVDSLALTLRTNLIPGCWKRDATSGEDEFCEVAAIPRSLLRGILENPDHWKGIPRLPADDDRPGNGFEVVDLSRIEASSEKPVVGRRVDGVALFYPGKVNVVFGDSEGGKTWLCLLATAQLLRAGRAVTYIDYEDSPRGIKSRLLALDVPASVLNDPELFLYMNPWGPIGDELKNQATRERLLGCDLVVVDAMTEALSAAGLNSNSDVDVAHWFNTFAKPIAALGPAVVIIDHTPKAADNKTQQTGSQHKKSAVDGCSVAVVNRKPFREGAEGYSALIVGKDRPGAVRSVSEDGKVFGLMRMDATTGPASLRIELPSPSLSAEDREAALDYLVAGIIEQREKAEEKVTVREVIKAFRAAGHQAKTAALEASIRRVRAAEDLVTPSRGDVTP